MGSDYFRDVRMGHPSITVSVLSRDTCSEALAMLLCLGRAPSGFDFPFLGAFDFGVAVALDVAFVLCSFDQGSLLESCGGTLVPPTIYPITLLPTMIRCSNSPTCSGRQGAQSGQRCLYWPTRVPLGLPCMRTSCA
jgi:hypothetical protein